MPFQKLGQWLSRFDTYVKLGAVLSTIVLVFFICLGVLMYSALQARTAASQARSTAATAAILGAQNKALLKNLDGLIREFHDQAVADRDRQADAEKRLPAILKDLASQIAAQVTALSKGSMNS